MSSKEGILFTQTQKKGILVLLAVILVVAAGLFISRSAGLPESTAFSFPGKAVVSEREEAPILLDINIADSNQWVSLKGIGPVLARRILNYREMMGGFSSIDQVANVYGLRPEVFDEIKSHMYTSSATIPTSAYKAVSAPQRKDFSSMERLDINVAQASDFEQLPGIGKVLSQRIINYRKALGGFEDSEQIGKVFNLDPEVFARIEPYLYVETSTVPAELLAKNKKKLPPTSTPYPSGNGASKTSDYIAARQQGQEVTTSDSPAASSIPDNTRSVGTTRGMTARIQVVDINLADSAQLVALPGIGEKLAPRIIRYRTLLGYFTSLDQLKHVYGLSEGNYQLMVQGLRIGDTSQYPRKDLNAAPAYRLAGFPNISRQLSESIVNHRKQLGWFESWDQVAMVNGMTPEALNELKSYFDL